MDWAADDRMRLHTKKFSEEKTVSIHITLLLQKKTQ
jgi:hypothetical protein